MSKRESHQPAGDGVVGPDLDPGGEPDEERPLRGLVQHARGRPGALPDGGPVGAVPQAGPGEEPGGARRVAEAGGAPDDP